MGALVLVGLACLALAPTAPANQRKLSYRGYHLQVPSGWPVFRITARSHTCVRFNRRAVYLGQPGRDQLCPPSAIGRSEAILVQPLTAAAARSTPAPSGSAVRIVNSRDRVLVTATWRTAPGLIRRALGLRTLRPSARATRAGARAETTGGSSLGGSGATTGTGTPAGSGATPGATYVGLGFDTCSTPSTSVMSAWKTASPFGAIGVYIGGVNAACHNLSATWVSTESASGWHLIPIYVGLQAPGACSGCAPITASTAAAQGQAAATDAIAQAQAVGIGTGNPIYDDMEAYAHTAANTKTVLAFLSAWTTTLQAGGYRSGVYSSEGSGIADLVSSFGARGVAEPDDIWFANWNGSASVVDANVPTADWPNGRRLHQYAGAKTYRYGGQSLSIDRDYVDADTAAAGSAGAVASAPPAATRSPAIRGLPVVGQVLNVGHANWSGGPTGYSYQWSLCDATGSGCTAVPGATARTYTVPASAAGDTFTVTESAANTAGSGGGVTSAATAPIAPAVGGYRLYTAFGNIYNSVYEPFYGSPASRRRTVSTITGMATTSDDRGYWLVTRQAQIYRYGDAARMPNLRHAHPIVGIVASASGGYWLYTAQGNVYNSRGTPWYGSPSARHISTRSIVGMAMNHTGRGYWVASSAGTVYRYGNAAAMPTLHVTHRVAGIVAAPRRGYWLYTAHGNVYNSRGARWYGSPAAAGIRTNSIVGLLATPDGGGYWLVTSSGTVYAYGDATTYPALSPGHPIRGF